MGQRLSRAGVLLVVALGVGVVLRFSSTFAGQSDTASYMNSARLLARGELSEPIRLIDGVNVGSYRPSVFAPVGFRPGLKADTLVTVYPLGYPLHLAAVSWLVGLDRAAAWVNAAAFAAAVALLYGIALQLGLSPWYGLVAVVVFACFPVTVLAFTRVMSDGVATAWCVAAFFLALGSHRRQWMAAAAGLAFGVSVLVRPTSLVVAPALLLAMPFDRRSIVRFVLGGAPAAVFLGVCNVRLYGELAASGHTGQGQHFRLAHVWPCAVFFAQWLGRFLSPLPLVLAAAGVWKAIKGDRRMLAVLVWAAGVIGVYSLYWHSYTGGWWRLRYILPALPALLLAALLVAGELLPVVRRRAAASRPARVLLAAGLVVALGWPVGVSLHKVESGRLWAVSRQDGANLEAVKWIEQRIEPSAVVMAFEMSGSLQYYSSHPVVRYDELTGAEFERLRREAAAAGVPIYSLLNAVDMARHRQRYTGLFEPAGRVGGVSLWRLEATEPPRRLPQPGS